MRSLDFVCEVSVFLFERLILLAPLHCGVVLNERLVFFFERLVFLFERLVFLFERLNLRLILLALLLRPNSVVVVKRRRQPFGTLDFVCEVSVFLFERLDFGVRRRFRVLEIASDFTGAVPILFERLVFLFERLDFVFENFVALNASGDKRQHIFYWRLDFVFERFVFFFKRGDFVAERLDCVGACGEHFFVECWLSCSDLSV